MHLRIFWPMLISMVLLHFEDGPRVIIIFYLGHHLCSLSFMIEDPSVKENQLRPLLVCSVRVQQPVHSYAFQVIMSHISLVIQCKSYVKISMEIIPP